MSTIHRTTLTPTKLELLSAWLPAQPWYRGAGSVAAPAKAGGFRLDDPAGEVGLEFMAVTDGTGTEAVTYHVPLAYRGAPLDGAEQGLVGIVEHGVLGRRWVYDGAHDPVLVAQLLRLALGSAQPQAQSLSDTPDPSVLGDYTGERPDDAAPAEPVSVVSGPRGTEVLLRTGADDAAPGLLLHLHRVLREEDAHGTPGAEAVVEGAVVGLVRAPWTAPDASRSLGRYAEFRVVG